MKLKSQLLHLKLVLTKPFYLALIFCCVGGFGLLIGTLINNIYALYFPFALIVGSVIYILYANFKKEFKYTWATESQSPPNIKLLLIIYVVLIAGISISQITTPYERTLIQHALTSLLYIVPIYTIVLYRRPVISLIMIVLSGIAHRANIYYSSALYIGNDTFLHNDWVAQIIYKGTIDILENKYYYAPFYHLSVAEGGLITGLEVRHSAFFVSTVVSVITLCIVVYKIGSILGDEQIGCTAALLYITADFVIQRSIQPTTTVIGMIFFALGLMSAMNYIKTGEKRQLILVLAFTLTLLFTHQLSAFIFAISILGYLSFRMFKNASHVRKPVNLSITVVSAIILDFFITRQDGPGSEQFFDYLITRLVSHLARASVDARTQTILPDDPALSFGGSEGLTGIHVLGMSILLGSAIFGSLYWLSKEHNDETKKVSYGLGGITFVTLVIVLSGPLVGIRTVIPYRWFPFIYLPISILGSILFLIVFHEVLKTSHQRSFVVGIMIVALLSGGYLLVMTGNFAGSYDDPLFDQAQGAEKYGISEQERKMYQNMENFNSGETIYIGDFRAIRMLHHYYGLETETIRMEYQKPESIPNNNNKKEIIINRKYLSMPQAQFELLYRGEINRIHGAINIDKFDQTKRSTIYDVGDHDLQQIH